MDLHEISDFAERHIASRPDLGQTHDFPHDLWQTMATDGLMGRYIAPEHGGLGLGWADLQGAAERLVRHGGNPGIVLSWMLHGMACRFVLANFANPEQQAAHLGPLARGEVTVSVAVSEPGMGGSPKRLATTAERDGDDWLLNGSKMYLTNGPIAGLFVIFAVTGVVDGRKQFGAFLVPRDAPGLTVTEMGAVDFLLPSPHGGLELKNCRVVASAELLTGGNAFAMIAKPFRVVEDIIGLGVACGGMGYQLDQLVARAGGDGAMAEVVGELAALCDGGRVIAAQLAHELDAQTLGDDYPPALIAARALARMFRERYQTVRDGQGEPIDPALTTFTRDMAKLGDLGAGIVRARQQKLGLSLLAQGK